MKLVSVRDLRTKSASVWKDLDQAEDLVLTNNGKPIALVTAVTEETLEDSLRLMRRLRGMATLEKIHRESLAKSTSRKTVDEIDVSIKKVRKRRKK